MTPLILKEFIGKYYDTLNEMVNECARKCIGGEEVTLNFTAGKVTIKLK